ncbi:NAD(P)-dependent oxidoreductase [soil metagenome]
MKVMVTGANGFLGRHVVAALRRRGHQVRALVRPASNLDGLGWGDEVEIVLADLRGPVDSLIGAFEGVDVLVHLAAAITGGEDAQFAAAVVGTERLLGAMARSETRKLVVASSYSVYDWSAARGELTEDTPVEPAPDLYDRDGYAIAKVWQERVARRLSIEHQWSLTVLRPGFIWGLGNEDLACLGQTFGRVRLVIAPLARLPLTYVENCADLFALAAEDPLADGQTFNVVDGDEIRTWRYLTDYLQGSGRRDWRLPVPYALARLVVAIAQFTSKRVFRGKGKLPSLLIPCRFEARFKPLRHSHRRATEILGWRPLLTYRDCLKRINDSSPSSAAPNVVTTSQGHVPVPGGSNRQASVTAMTSVEPRG